MAFAGAGGGGQWVSGQQISSAARVRMPRVIGARAPGCIPTPALAAFVVCRIGGYACPLCVLPRGRRGGGGCS